MTSSRRIPIALRNVGFLVVLIFATFIVLRLVGCIKLTVVGVELSGDIRVKELRVNNHLVEFNGGRYSPGIAVFGEMATVNVATDSGTYEDSVPIEENDLWCVRGNPLRVITRSHTVLLSRKK